MAPSTKYATPLVALGVPGLAWVVATLMCGCILTTYLLCIMEDKCPRLPKLPTISDTWVPIPGNYISRIVVSVAALLLQGGNLAMYFMNEARRSPSTPSSYPSNQFLAQMAYVAVFLFSWVGAICDSSSNPTCEGQGTVHTTCAVTFFILYNVYEVLLVEMPTKQGYEVRNRTSLRVMLGLSALSKLRFIPAVQGHFDETPLAIFEWGDVALMMAVLVQFLSQHATDLSLTLVRSSSSSEDEEEEGKVAKVATVEDKSSVRVLSDMTTDRFATVGAGLGLATIVVSWALAVHQGVVKSGELPNISDVFVHKPENWISRWGIVLTGSLMTATTALAYYVRADPTVSTRGLLSKSWLAVVTLVGLASNGAIMLFGANNIGESTKMHEVCGAVFFGGYSVYMLLYTVDELVAARANVGFRFAGQVLAFVVSLVSKVRFPVVASWLAKCLCSSHVGRIFCHFVGVNNDGTNASDPYGYQWADLGAIAGFLTLTVLLHPVARRFSLAITTPASALRC